MMTPEDTVTALNSLMCHCNTTSFEFEALLSAKQYIEADQAARRQIQAMQEAVGDAL